MGPRTTRVDGGPRPADHATSGTPDQSAEAQARGRNLRVAEDGRRVPEAAAPWPRASGVDVHLRGGRLQFGPPSEPGTGGILRPLEEECAWTVHLGTPRASANRFNLGSGAIIDRGSSFHGSQTMIS